MSFFAHHAVIVTSCDRDSIACAHRYAKSLFENVSGILNSHCNGYKSFFIPPDGSKEGWDESNEGDKRRSTFVEFLSSQEDLEWCKVMYGGDLDDDYIVNSRNKVKNL